MNDRDIRRYISKPPIAKIGVSTDYELEQARRHAGISLSDWEAMPGAHIWITNGSMCKSDILVLYRLNQRVDSVGNDVTNRHLERQRKR